MRYPTVAEALSVAASLLDVVPSVLATDHTVHLLDSALHAPQATFGGEDLVVGLLEKAATLAFHISRNHPLPDGNKRLAWMMMNVFLELNGHTLERDTARAICLMWSVAASEADVDAIVRVAGQWIQPLDAALV